MKKILVFIAVLMMTYTANAQRIVSDVTEGNTRTVTCNYEPITRYVNASLSLQQKDGIKTLYLNLKFTDDKIKRILPNEKLTITTSQENKIILTTPIGAKAKNDGKKYKINNKLVTINSFEISYPITAQIPQILNEEILEFDISAENIIYKYDQVNFFFVAKLKNMVNLLTKEVKKAD